MDRRREDNLILRQQCEEIKNYIDTYPKIDKEKKIFEWIEKYASTYRENMEGILKFVNRSLNEC